MAVSKQRWYRITNSYITPDISILLCLITRRSTTRSVYKQIDPVQKSRCVQDAQQKSFDRFSNFVSDPKGKSLTLAISKGHPKSLPPPSLNPQGGPPTSSILSLSPLPILKSHQNYYWHQLQRFLQQIDHRCTHSISTSKPKCLSNLIPMSDMCMI